MFVVIARCYTVGSAPLEVCQNDLVFASADEVVRCLTTVMNDLAFDLEHNAGDKSEAREALGAAIRSVIECRDWITRERDASSQRLNRLIDELKSHAAKDAGASQVLSVQIRAIRHCVNPMQLSQ